LIVTKLSRLAFIGNSLPRRCGIATFTTDLQQAVAAAHPEVETAIVAMTDHGQAYTYPPVVRLHINDETIEDYLGAAAMLNAGRYDVVSLQHEFGIFGGEAGDHILALLARLTMPVVTTLHTILADPTPAQRRVLDGVVNASAKVIVMAEKGRDLLRAVHQVPADKIEVIPHGIPDFAFVGPDEAKQKRGFAGRKVILTFGLLSPSKGIEVMIDAMPAILARCPDAVYVVLGATHPNLVRQHGEAYRDSLAARAHALGIEERVVFLDQFVDKPTLLEFIAMCDVYVTPYLNATQMTSGTLAYSFGLGKPVVSTPYWHAQELLADGSGILVPFGNAAATGAAIAGLLTDDARRQAMRKRAYVASRATIWPRVAERYVAVFEAVARGRGLRIVPGRDPRASPRPPEAGALPEMRLDHLLAMCDDTGLMQHAVHSVPDRAHGYCVDDNARALLLACALNGPGEQHLPDILATRLAAFVQHAWNPETRRFRNFMGFDRRWLEAAGSEDSHGRTLWALGTCARDDRNASRRRWAAALFVDALPSVLGFSSPRAWAFTLLGLDAYCAANQADLEACRIRRLLADRLNSLLTAVVTHDWVWFEDGLSYDNARLPQALILTGQATGDSVCLAAGLRALRWLAGVQTMSAGLFRPVGTEGFFDQCSQPRHFDQQPVEATATISACRSAAGADRVGDPDEWCAEADRAFAWFFGANDLGIPLVDVDTGSCRDGLHPDRANENRGAESVLSYLLALADMRQMAQVYAGRSKIAAHGD
jgi:glycosyltransferase involved in cell wall biosynthesis